MPIPESSLVAETTRAGTHCFNQSRGETLGETRRSPLMQRSDDTNRSLPSDEFEDTVPRREVSIFE